MLGIKLPNLKDPDTKFIAILSLGAVVVVALFLFAIAMPLASNPTFCGKACHNMAPEWETWKKSSHAAVTCYACHGDRNYVTFFREKLIKDPLGIFSQVLNTYEKPINKESEYSQADLPRERCERCHTNENRKFTFTKGIYMNHEAHKAAGLQCSTCHNRITHLGAENYEPLKSEWEEAKGFKYENFLEMKEGCFRCHSANPAERNEETLKIIENDKTPPQACTTCHTKDFNLPSGHGQKDWRSNHGSVAKRDFTYCFSCHDGGAKFDNEGKPWCTVCHDSEKADSFKKQASI